MIRGTVLVVDAGLESRKAIHEYLAPQGYRVLEAANDTEAVLQLRRYRVDVLVIDHRLSVRDLIGRLEKTGLLVPFIVLVAYGDVPSACQAMRHGAAACVARTEPDFLEQLHGAVIKVVRPRRRRRLWSWLPLLLSVALAVVMTIYAVRLQQVEQRTATQRQLVCELLECANQAFIVISPDYRIVVWSRGAEEILGWRAVDVIGRSPADLFDATAKALSDRDPRLKGLATWHREAFLADQDGTDTEVRVINTWALRKDGTPVYLNIIARPVPNHIGVYHMAIVTELPAPVQE